jgi:hypothetical protein
LFYIQHSFPPWLYVILLHFAHDPSKWSFLSFSSTTFQNLDNLYGTTFTTHANDI